MKKIIFTLLSFILSSSILSQDLPIEWQNTIGGFETDEVYDAFQTTDGGYIIASSSWSGISGDKTEPLIGILDYWVIKLDATGVIEWQNTIGGTGGERLISIAQTNDGGYILGGYSSSNISGDKTEDAINNTRDYWVIKLNTSGIIEWQNTIGGNNFDLLFSISQTADGGYITGGYSASNISGDKTENLIGERDYWVVKLNSSGTIEWQNTIGGTGDDRLRSIKQTTDGGYILGGYSTSNISGDKTENSNGGSDYWVIKLDTFGVIEWQNTIGGNDNEELLSISLTNDGGYILGGHSFSNISGDKTENSNGGSDYWIIKLDTFGAIEWQNTIGGSDNEFLSSVIQTLDGGYFAGGWSYSNISGDKTENSNGSSDYWIIKLDDAGIIEIQNTIGGSESEVLNKVIQQTDGNFALVGWSASGISGDKTEELIGATDIWIINVNNSTLGVDENEISNSFSMYPNPTDSFLTINSNGQLINQISIFSITGKLIKQVSFENSETKKTIDVSLFTTGMYLVKIISNEKVVTKKFIKK